MARGRGSPFIQLIRHHMQAAEYAYNSGDGLNAISNLKSAGILVRAKLPNEPMTQNPYVYPLENQKLKMWFVKNKPAVAQAVRAYVDAHGNHGVGLAGDDDEDEGEE